MLSPWNIDVVAETSPLVDEWGDPVRVVTRQQLRDPDFYERVRQGVLFGTVKVLDEHSDEVRGGDGRVLALTSPEGKHALTASQREWLV